MTFQIHQILSFILFADDSNIFYSHRDPQFLLNKVNIEIKFVQDWICANKLSLNIKKTNHMVFSNTVNSLPGHICINSVTLRQIECTKFLGLYVDGWRRSLLEIPHLLFMQIALEKHRNFVQTERNISYSHFTDCVCNTNNFVYALWYTRVGQQFVFSPK